MKQDTGTQAERRTAGPRHTILVVDDHPVTRLGVSALVRRERDLWVCGDADGARAAIDLVPKLEPDLAIVDLSHGTIGGIELIRSIRSLRPQTRVLVLSMQDESYFAERALRAGASGYVMKRQPLGDILTAIRRVLSGELYLSDAMKERMLHRVVKSSREDVVFSFETLTDREMEVFHLIGNGYRRLQIAAKLHLSAKTIDSHRENLKRKLGGASGGDLVRHAIQWVRSECPA
jgi:DNA-binding NarL/FixJ family response regulator